MTAVSQRGTWPAIPLLAGIATTVLGSCSATDPRVTALEEAEQHYRASPSDELATIWYGRRLAYLGLYDEAIRVYSEGLRIHPDSYRLLRHRGHRRLTTRDFPAAVADLAAASRLISGVPDTVEPDGAPNAFNIPRSTTHSNIWYHLGLAHYLMGDLGEAERAYRECLKFSRNDDMLCAASHWLYMTLRRLGRDVEAAEVLERIEPEMDILENFAYHRLLLFYRGWMSEAEVLADQEEIGFATVGYGIGNWHHYHGREAEAQDWFRRVVDAGPAAAFGAIAAEAQIVAAPSTGGAD